MTTVVVSAIAPTLEQAEIERAKRKPTESLEAYDYFLRAKACMYRWAQKAAMRHYACSSKQGRSTLPLPPPMAMAAECYWLRIASGWISDLDREKTEANELARRGARLGENDAVALAAAAHALAYVVHDLDTAAIFVERALTLDPNLAAAWGAAARFRPGSAILTGIDHLTCALRLSRSIRSCRDG